MPQIHIHLHQHADPDLIDAQKRIAVAIERIADQGDDRISAVQLAKDVKASADALKDAIPPQVN